MGGERLQEFSHKSDAELNVLIAKLRVVTTANGADAYSLFKQGSLSKKELLELIAKAVAEMDK